MKHLLLYVLPLIAMAACNQPQNTNSPETASDTAHSESSARNEGGSATAFKAADAIEQAVYSRAFNAVIWGMPAVNFELMAESLSKAKGDFNQVVYWSKPVTAINQTLTPNPDVIYVNPFYDTRKGPVVLEIPPASGISSITGSIDDSWQLPIEDVGPAGLDKGKGGKYLLLPPGFKGKVPSGYFPLPVETYTGFVILRSNLGDRSEQDMARAVDYGKQVKIYPLAEAGNSPKTVYLDLLQTPFGNVIPYDLHFFESLNSFVQREPWLERDMAMIDPLKTIGIEKGKAFSPNARTKEILAAAAKDAHAFIRSDLEKVFDPPFYEGTHWALPVSPATVQAMTTHYNDVNFYPIDQRAVAYSLAYFSAKHLGTGQFYLMNIQDKVRQPLIGSKTYKLNIPANVPVKLYWSVTVYDAATHALVTGMPYASRASNSPGLQKNADGSVDLWFSATAPEGKSANWIPVNAKGNFELLARFYGPEKAFFEKAWKMGDPEEVK
ncbi:DUF1254 domain-containing protein [Flavihumibacter petaseus]|uniref:DUF1254 domain-containing protein n=1 Tax=Flavihumibacter petaseus NBRC 106054 TaxID=1220578 RepID=A0A0E9N2D7_9BACT|nr:DUF1254 domain-containing protein [Flavihumibacter petaseus]GAO44167.1 hypothetical protein FPE01S_03_02050 [Flavihumibacter petaseus NBRC 106054]